MHRHDVGDTACLQPARQQPVVGNDVGLESVVALVLAVVLDAAVRGGKRAHEVGVLDAGVLEGAPEFCAPAALLVLVFRRIPLWLVDWVVGVRNLLEHR